jgi:thioesterase domain-containing protein
MLDTPCPPSGRVTASGKWQYRLMRCASHIRNLSRLGFTDAFRYLLVRSRLLMRASLPARPGTRTPDVAASLASIANRAAIYRYRPQPYRGRIELFMAQEPYPSLREDTRDRWRELGSDVRMHRVAGLHSEMLRQPQAIADLINAELSSSDAITMPTATSNAAGQFNDALLPTGRVNEMITPLNHAL